MALLAALPNMPQAPQESSPPAAAAKREPPVLAVSAKMQATVLAMPVAIAMAAICTSAPPVAPPMVMLPVKRGLIPSSSPTAR